MPAIMADNDIQGQFKGLVRILQSPTWLWAWNGLGLTVSTFEALGLKRETPDIIVWQACQAHEVVLITGNRNNEGPDSLEAAIRTLNRADSLPVITLSDSKRFGYDPAYAGKVAERVLDILLYLENHRGAGRLYVP